MVVLLNAQGQRIDAAPKTGRILPQLRRVATDKVSSRRFARTEEQRFYCHDGYFRLRQPVGLATPFHLINMPFYQNFGIATKVSQNPLAAQADAREFVVFMQGRPGDFSVVEFGVGNGQYALDFVVEVAKQDASLLPRMRYVIVDNSFTLLRAFQEQKGCYLDRLGTVELVLCDPFRSFPAILEARSDVALIRFNEFFDDLPATEIIFKQGQAYELYVRLFLSSIAGMQPQAGATLMSLVLGLFGGKGPSVEEIAAAALDLEKILYEDDRLLPKFLPYVNMEVGYGPVDDLAEIDFAFLLEGQAQDGEPVTFNYAAYHHFLICLKVLKQSGGYMRFNDYRPKLLLSDTLLGLSGLRHLTSPINWAHFRRLAQEQRVSFETKPHEVYLSHWQEQEYLDPAIIMSADLVEFLTSLANDKDIPDPKMVRQILLNYYSVCLNEKVWVTAKELVLEIPENVRAFLAIKDRNYAIALRAWASLHSRPFVPVPGTEMVDAATLEALNLGRLFQKGEFELPSFLREEPDPFEHRYGQGYEWFAEEMDGQNKYQATKHFVFLMFALLGEAWRQQLLLKIKEAQDLAPTMLSAKVL